MRTYIRRLKNCGLRSGYISASAFKGVTPKKLFLCIWPSDPNITNRARFFVCAENLLTLCASQHVDENKYILKFDKTANVFDEDGFFWTTAKGHNFQIETEEIENNRLHFRINSSNKNRYFRDMLSVIFGEEQQTYLSEYLQKNFRVEEKNTYAFCIYMQVKFHKDKICFGDTSEQIYRFVSPCTFLGNINISAILYEYSKEYKAKMTSMAVDPKIIEEVQGENDLQIDTKEDVRSVLKNCISGFLHNKDSRKINDEDYALLVEDILENLSKIYHENE